MLRATSAGGDAVLQNSTPLCYQGLWRRRLLEQGDHIDLDTTVYWLQSGRLYADIRVPANRPVCGSLAGASLQTLRGLAHQQGFAGALDVEGNVLSWHRWLDYQPPAPIADVGRVHFEHDVLVENGVLAPYREEWVRMELPNSDRIALTLESETDAQGAATARIGVFIAMGSVFMLALARQQPLSTGAPTVPISLEQLIVDPACTDSARLAMLDCGIDFGHRHDRDWQIALSTLPSHEGRSLAAIHGTWTAFGENSYVQELQSEHTGSLSRHWRIVERGDMFTRIP